MAGGQDQTAKKDNIPATVDTTIEFLNEAHAIVSRMRPEPTEEEKPPEAAGLEAAVVQVRDKASHLCNRLRAIADSVGQL